MADTTKTDRDPKVTYTPPAILCFADGLFKPRPPAQGAEPRYQATLLFPQESIELESYQDLRRACLAAITEKWGTAKGTDAAFLKTLRLPFRDASEKDYDGFEQGVKWIAPWKKGDQDPPGVVNRLGVPLARDKVFSGQLVRAVVRAFAYEQVGNKGVNFGLEAVQVLNSAMPRLDGRRSATEAFKNADNSELEKMGIDMSKAEDDPALVDIPF